MENFRLGMRQLAGAVTVVSAGVGEQEIAGLTATAVCSLTAEPPRLLACLNMRGRTFDILSRSGRFCVNLIGQHHRHVAERFAGMAGPAASESPFTEGEWAMAEDRAPRLLSAIAAFECRVHSINMLATHGLVIGDVEAVHVQPGAPPLLYHDGAFARLAALTPT